LHFNIIVMQKRNIIHIVLIATGISLAPVFLQAQSIRSKNETDTIKSKHQMSYKVNIGRITVPKEVIEEFRKQASITPSFLKNLPGYVKGDYYEMFDEAGNLHLLSVVTWENEMYYRNAQLELNKYYEQIHFNRMEFVKRLNLSIEYVAYNVAQM
jgi:hypothetical protein